MRHGKLRSAADDTLRLAEAGFRTVAVNWRGIDASTGPLDGLTLHHLALDHDQILELVLNVAFYNMVYGC